MMQDRIDAAIAALDRALDDRPDHVYGDLAEAVRCVAALRDDLIEQRRTGHETGQRLGRVNAILSHVVASEYPLEGVRRQRIETARDELAGLRSKAEA